MTTTHASTAAPKPVESGHKPSQNTPRADADKPGAADLFSTLLGLVSDTHLPPSTEQAAAEPAAQDTEAETDPAALNPLAALLAWITPAPAAAEGTEAGKTVATSTTTPATQTTPATDAEAPHTGVDIEGMTRVDEAAPALPNAAAQARAAAASRPAFSPLHPNAPTAPTSATRTADGQAPHGHAPAMAWQRSAVSGTEALQQQHATQLAQMRSTVTLNARFGTAGAPAELGAAASTREAATSITTSSGAAAGGPQAHASAPGSGAAVVDGATGADTASGGDSHASDTGQDTGAGDGQADASREAEGPSVSHWGTQHLRHASLRVGEGAADAIDIQLQLKGQEVQVAFQTDNAEARASLRENAGESLADLMQRSGMQLGGVSVGSQGSSQSGDAQARGAAGGGLRTGAAGRSAPAADPVVARPTPQPRADGSRPLDVFA